MSAPPFMQLYVADYISDTLHLTTEQHGAYLLILMSMWRSDGRLPNDPAKLARICRVSPKRWPQVWGEIASLFAADGEFLTNERLTKELQKAVSISKERKNSASLGGKAKALKDKEARLANGTDLLCHSQISDTDIRKEVVVEGARAEEKEAATAAVVDLHAREKILKAIGLGPDGTTGPSSFIGGMGDMAESEKWNQTGLSLDEQLRVISEVCERQRRRAPQWMPRGFGYFTQAIADLAARKKAPIPAGDPNGQYGGKMSDRDRKMASYQRIKASHGG